MHIIYFMDTFSLSGQKFYFLIATTDLRVISKLFQQQICPLTLSWRRPKSYRNQSIDLLRKSMDWFLYDNGLRHERLKRKTETRLAFPFLKTRSFDLQPLWKGESKLWWVWSPCQLGEKKSSLFLRTFKVIVLLQKLANLKIWSYSLDWVCKILKFWSNSWYF